MSCAISFTPFKDWLNSGLKPIFKTFQDQIQAGDFEKQINEIRQTVVDQTTDKVSKLAMEPGNKDFLRKLCAARLCINDRVREDIAKSYFKIVFASILKQNVDNLDLSRTIGSFYPDDSVGAVDVGFLLEVKQFLESQGVFLENAGDLPNLGNKLSRAHKCDFKDITLENLLTGIMENHAPYHPQK